MAVLSVGLNHLLYADILKCTFHAMFLIYLPSKHRYFSLMNETFYSCFAYINHYELSQQLLDIHVFLPSYMYQLNLYKKHQTVYYCAEVT